MSLYNKNREKLTLSFKTVLCLNIKKKMWYLTGNHTISSSFFFFFISNDIILLHINEFNWKHSPCKNWDYKHWGAWWVIFVLRDRRIFAIVIRFSTFFFVFFLYFRDPWSWKFIFCESWLTKKSTRESWWDTPHQAPQHYYTNLV